MIMDAEIRNKQIEQYLDSSCAEFDALLEEGNRKRQRKVIRWTALCGVAAAASIALLLWLSPQRSTQDMPLTPVQITEGIQQMMLLDIGEIESIVATPMGSYAILTATLTDGSSCSYILKCNDAEGTTTLLAYTNN